jgi:bifunctional non-homologous end joining protein LigD
MTYHAFDLLYLDGFDIRAAPLVERKCVLAAFLDSGPKDPRIQFVEHLEDDGHATNARLHRGFRRR